MRIRLLSASCLFGCLTLPVQASLMVQDLFDNMALNVTLHGQGDNGSSQGFQAGGSWAVNAGGTIFTANNFNVESSPVLPGLSPQLASLGGIWKGGGNDWNTAYWATRPLDTPVNFDAVATYYFSFRLNNSADTAMGVGFASGSAATSTFVGVGAHWDNHLDVLGQNAANSLYITGGTLNQDLTGNNDGPYAAISHSAAQSVNGRGLVVGRLITGAGSDQIDVKFYGPGSALDSDVGAIAWTTSLVTPVSMNASHLLVWINGSGNGELDAFRLGTEWVDVTGVVAVPEPSSMVLLGVGLLWVGRRRFAA